ncbi:MAG: hypothetical protein IKL48_03155 [Elusimicrobiaceae bacterium]|nr:hypothetical protein [Elusimicrobiaceae bacterium]
MTSTDLLDNISQQTDSFRNLVLKETSSLRDFTRRLEQILSQDHKNIQVRDTAFSAEFSSFCTSLRKEFDQQLNFWQENRPLLRTCTLKADYSLVLAAKSFSLRAKTLSRSADDFSTAYNNFNRFYKKYTLEKLPVWLLTSCCDDLNNLTGKILFLSREVSKKTGEAK